VYRCKGVIHSAEHPDRRAILQVVGKRVDITVEHEWNGREPRSRIIVIGAVDGIDEAALAKSSTRVQCGYPLGDRRGGSAMSTRPNRGRRWKAGQTSVHRLDP
jgi:hypothetical protein